MRQKHESQVSTRPLSNNLLFNQQASKPWGAGARAFLTDVGSRVKQATGNPRAMEFLRQRVSIEIQRGNAASVMGTVDNAKDWSALFLLT